MKILIFASFLILYVNSSCSRRPLDKCLRDEQCQIIGTQCEKRPQCCEQIDASNPNNCSGFKCYYNKELQICQTYKKLLNQQFHKRDKQKQGEQQIQESEQLENNNEQQNAQTEDPENSNQNIQASGNSLNENSDELDTNSELMDKSLTTIQNSEVDYSKQDTIVFQIVDINFNQDELDNTEDLQKELVLVASSTMIITFVIIQLIF